MSCQCARIPDPGVCPFAHDGWMANGHCRCAHPDYEPPTCECRFDNEARVAIFCDRHWAALEVECVSEPNLIRALANLARHPTH